MATRNTLKPGRLTQTEQEMINIESYLLQTLGPVKPRQEFVQNLRGRLASPPAHQAMGINSTPKFLLVFGGLVGSILILVTSVKAALSLIEAIKTLRNRKSQTSNTDRSHSASLIKSISTGN